MKKDFIKNYIFPAAATLVIVFLIVTALKRPAKSPSLPVDKNKNNHSPARKNNGQKTFDITPELIQSEPVKKTDIKQPEKTETKTHNLSPASSPNVSHRREIKGRLFMIKLLKDMRSFTPAQLQQLRKKLIEKNEVNPAEFALKFTEHDDADIKKTGLAMLADICIKRTDCFRPNEFYKAFAKEGSASSPSLSRIIEQTDDDFCRAWACELAADIYMHTAPKNDSRRQKLIEFAESEKALFDSLKALIRDEQQLKKTAAEPGGLGDMIIKRWGPDRRFTLKMLALIANFDLMHPENIKACRMRAEKILDTFNFNYNILGRIDSRPVERPSIPLPMKLKRLADAVFSNRFQDTFRWIMKRDGGFTVDELEIAVETGDTVQMKHMISVLRKIIADALKAKILLGLGQNELALLEYFNYGLWNKHFKWSNRMLIINNRKGAGVKMLITDTDADKKQPFHVPSRSTFIWFLPEDDYHISIPGKHTKFFGFDSKEIKLKKKNITLDLVGK